MEHLEKCEVKKVLGPLEGGAAIFLGNKKKTFVVYVGLYEASAIVKEINRQSTIRPLTHDLLQSILLGFDINLKKVIISKIVDNTFCATLILEQKSTFPDPKDPESTREVRIDARASDSIILALKNGKEIWVSEEVFSMVEDVSKHMADLPTSEEEPKENWKGTDIPGMNFEVPDYPPDDPEEP